MEQTMHFTVTGEFITETARAWFWQEKRPYKVVENFLLNCMCGTDETQETLKELARDVIEGRRRFSGDSDAGLTLVSETEPETKKSVDAPISDYGWLSPSGIFHPAEWGEHEKWAGEYLREKNIYREYIMSGAEKKTLYTCADYLVDHGWALLHNPSMGQAEVTYQGRLTKAQREYLFGYFQDRGDQRKAEEFI